MPLPERIANAPELQVGLDLFYVAFLELGTCRSIGMAEGPIPWDAIQTYCGAYDIVGEQREDLFYHVRELDHVYMEWRAKQIKSPKGSKGSKGGKRS